MREGRTREGQSWIEVREGEREGESWMDGWMDGWRGGGNVYLCNTVLPSQSCWSMLVMSFSNIILAISSFNVGALVETC